MRMFALSESKGWVELRSSSTPPRISVTRASKMVERTLPARYVVDNGGQGGMIRYTQLPGKTVKEKRTIIHTAWIGGRVLGTLPARRFSALFNVGVRRGGCIELLPSQKAEVRALLAREKKCGKQNKVALPETAPYPGTVEAT